MGRDNDQSKDLAHTIRMSETIRTDDQLEKIGPLQRLAQYLGVFAYTPEGHRIVKRRKRYHGQIKLITSVKETGEVIYERTYWERSNDSIKPPKRHYNFERYKTFNPQYDLTS